MIDTRYVERIKTAVNGMDQPSLFAAVDGSKQAELTAACIEYLRSAGYRVVCPSKQAVAVNNIMDLRNLYNQCYEKYVDLEFHPGTNTKKELQIFKSFVKKRMIGEVSEPAALKECATIVETVFKHRDEFSFKYAITPTTLCMDWVINKAIEIINKNACRSANREYEERMLRCLSNDEQRSIDDILDELSAMEG